MDQEIRCLEDLDEFGTEITDPDEALIQDNYHRLKTPPGGNIDDEDFGLGLDRLLSGDDSELGSLGPRIEAEFRKDPRNAQVQTLITPVGRDRYRVDIRIVTDKGQLLEMAVVAGRDGVDLV